MESQNIEGVKYTFLVGGDLRAKTGLNGNILIFGEYLLIFSNGPANGRQRICQRVRRVAQIPERLTIIT